MAHWASYIGFGFEKQECEKLLIELRKKLSQYEDNIAWHNPEYMHMTLQFLGWTKEGDISKLREILQRERIANIEFKLSGELILLGFNDQKEYIAMKIDSSEELLKYREILGYRMQQQGIPFKHQSFLSHISLGRVHGLNEIDNKKYFEPRIIKPNGVHLYESVPESVALVSVRYKKMLIEDKLER